MKLSGQQWVFKNISFSGTTTGVQAGGTDIVFLGCRFEQGTLGIDAQGTSGSLTVVDTTGVGMGTLISSSSSNTAGNSIVLDNVQNSGATVKIGGQTTLSGNVANTWVHGHLVSRCSTSPDQGSQVDLTQTLVYFQQCQIPVTTGPDSYYIPLLIAFVREKLFYHGATDV